LNGRTSDHESVPLGCTDVDGGDAQLIAVEAVLGEQIGDIGVVEAQGEELGRRTEIAARFDSDPYGRGARDATDQLALCWLRRGEWPHVPRGVRRGSILALVRNIVVVAVLARALRNVNRVVNPVRIAVNQWSATRCTLCPKDGGRKDHPGQTV